MRAVPCEEEASVPLPQGLVLVEDFVSLEEEAKLLAAIDWSSGNDDVTGKIFSFFVFCSFIFFSFGRFAYVSLMSFSSESSEAQKS